MKLFLLSSAISISVATLGAAIAPSPMRHAALASTEVVVLPLEKTRPRVQGGPEGADFRVSRGSSGVAFAACDEQRAFSNGQIEHGCRLYSQQQSRWETSVHWYSADEVRPLINNARIITALR
jgi:hypothetical protein